MCLLITKRVTLEGALRDGTSARERPKTGLDLGRKEPEIGSEREASS